MNASIGVALRQLAGVERAQSGILAHDLRRDLGGVRVVGADQHVGLDGLVEVAELLGRHVVEARRRPRQSGTAACTLAATEPRGGTSGWNSWPTRARALAMRDDDLALEAALRPAWAVVRGAVPRRGDDDEVGVGRAVVVAGVDGELAVRPLLARMPSRTSIARYFDREPMHDLEARRTASRAPRPLPAGPVPPRIPMRIGRSTVRDRPVTTASSSPGPRRTAPDSPAPWVSSTASASWSPAS